MLITAEWLHNTYDVDITCARLSLAIDAASGAEYLSCSPVFPTPELAQQAVLRRAPMMRTGWENWDAALKAVTNPAVSEFFKTQIQAKQEFNLGKRMLCYRVEGKRRFYVSAKTDRAYCWQAGRFDNDLAFWSNRLSAPQTIAPVADGMALRFFLSDAKDFAVFMVAATQELVPSVWASSPEAQEQENSEEVIVPRRADSI